MISVSPVPSRFPRKLSLAVVLLGLLGVIFSVIALRAHVLIEALGSGYQSFCNISSTYNCDAVNSSRWSTFLGVPVAGYGIIFYALVVYLGVKGRNDLASSNSAVIPDHTGEKLSDQVWLLGGLASLLSFGLFYISVSEIGAICIICIGLYLINFALFGLGLICGRGGPLKRLMRFSLKGRYKDGLIVAMAMALIVAVLPALFRKTAEPSTNAAGTPKQPVDNFASKRPTTEDLLQVWRSAPQQKILLRDDVNDLAERDYSHGPKDAPIQIVEFSDLECPACQDAFPILEKFHEDHPDQVRIVFKNFPLDKSCNPAISRDIHRYACFAAKLARCAGEQNRFWEALKAIVNIGHFPQTSSKNEVETAVVQEVSRVGLDEAKLKKCNDDPAGANISAITADLEAGEKLGVEGTPSIWINGRKLPQVDAALLERIAQELLSRTK